MKGLKKIGMFFTYWITTVVGCFLILFVTRFLVHQLDITAAISAPSEKLAEASVVFVFIGLIVAWRLIKKI